MTLLIIPERRDGDASSGADNRRSGAPEVRCTSTGQPVADRVLSTQSAGRTPWPKHLYLPIPEGSACGSWSVVSARTLSRTSSPARLED